MKQRNTELIKRIIATALSLFMVIGLLPFSAFAADSDANIEDSLSDFFSTTDKGAAPSQYTTAGDPYGEKRYFNLAPQHELLKLFTGGSRGSTNNDMYITEGVQHGSTDIDDYRNAGALISGGQIVDALNNWSYLQAVAFDPAGSGRDTHIAYVGYDASAKAIKLAVYDLVGKRAAANTRWVADATWIAEADGHSLMHFNAYNFMSITAGDYNGDGIDTLVVFASADGTATTLTEYYWSSGDNRIYEQARSNSLLHHDYISSGLGDSTKAYEKLGADLVTGDFDGDSIDDMAVISYQGLQTETNSNCTKAELLMPYLGIAMGCGKGEHIVSKSTNNRESYIYEYSETAGINGGALYTVVTAASLAAGDVDADGFDELMLTGLAGRVEKSIGNGKWYAWGLADAVPVYTYDIIVSGNTTTRQFLSGRFLDADAQGGTADPGLNIWTDEMINVVNNYAFWDSDPGGIIAPQLALDCVKTGGENAPEQLFLNGTLYSYSRTDNKWNFQYEDGYFSDVVGILDPDDDGDFEWEHQIGYITNVSTGVFDGNLVGREQVAYTVWLKDGTSGNLIGTTDNADDYTAMLGISGGSAYNDTVVDGEVVTYGAVTSYTSSGLNDRTNGYEDKNAHEFFNTQMDYTDAKNLLFLAVDVDYDGVLAQYAGKDYTYSDPSVITVLQAAPYYKDFGYLDDCATSYEVTTAFVVGQSESDASAFSVGMNVEGQAFCIKTAISTGYTQGWEESFTKEFETSYSTTFTATRDNVVVMQRTPVILYKYLVQDSKGEWSEVSDENGNFFTVSVPCEPVYALVSVDEYNDFVKEGSLYYSTMHSVNSANMLQPITSDMLLDNEGNPADYRDHWNGATNLSAATYEASSGTGHITSAYSSSSSATQEQKTTSGFYFDSTISIGFDSPFGVSAWAGVEVGKEGTRTQGTYTTTANSTTVSGTVANLGESGLPAEMLKNYVFNWEFGCWQLDMGVNTVWVYGYRVLNAKSGISLVDNLQVKDGDGDVESAVLTWDPVPGASGYAVYTYEDGQYTQIATTADNTYTYTIPTDTRQFEFVFAVTATVNGGDSIYSRLVKYYRQSYGMSAYEIAVQEGFEGTVEEWLESLVGTDGTDGVGLEGFSYNSDGELIATLTDGTVINLGVINGEDGKDGLTPYIDENGNWWIGEVDTGVKATGNDGADGKDGITPQLRINSETNEWEVSLDNGTTWTSIGVVATGAKGDTGEKGDKGDKGDKGEQGEAGVGIKSVELDTENSDDTKSVYVITLSDDTTYSFTVTHGEDGADGAKGEPGENGITPQLRINPENNEWEVSLDNGTTWTSTGVVATGAKGDTGEKGDKGDKGDKGERGEAGVGIASVELDTENSDEAKSVYTITLTDETAYSFTVNHGEDGAAGAEGEPGANGITPQLRINSETNEWEVSLDDGATWNSTGVKATGAMGEKGEKGDTGAQGEKGEKGDTGAQGEKGDKGDTGAAGIDGKDGTNGKDGVDGKDGADGKDGVDGKDGANGKDGLGIADIKIDENGNFIFTMSDGSTINAGTVPKDDSAQTMAGIAGGVTQEDISTVKTLATVAVILSSISLLWNVVSLFALVTRKKKTFV